MINISNLRIDPDLEARRPAGLAAWDFFHPTNPRRRIRIVRRKDPVYSTREIVVAAETVKLGGIGLTPLTKAAPVASLAEGRVTYPGAWTDSDVELKRSFDQAKGSILINSTKCPASFDFRVSLPPGCRLEGSRIVDGDGNLRAWIPGAWMAEFSPVVAPEGGVAPEFYSGEDDIGQVAFEQIGETVVRFIPDRAWLEDKNRKFPVILDPSVTRQGASYIEDAYGSGYFSNPPKNFGGRVLFYVGNHGGNICRAWLRLDSSAIPDGEITLFQLGAYCLGFVTGSVAILILYQIKPANDWVEGTADGTIQAGSSCWNYAKYDTQPWAGSAGCGTSGTDYFAWEAGDPETIVDATGAWFDWDIPTDWADARKAGEDEGILMVSNSEGTLTKPKFSSTEYTTDPDLQPYFYIEYEPEAATGSGRRRRMVQHRRIQC